MNISFSDKTLGKWANNDRARLKDLGKLRSEKYKLRIDQLAAANSLEDVRHLPGNWHELTGTRKGQWAADLDQPYRIVFTPHETPIPINEAGQFIWVEIHGVEILEIVNYHKEK